MARSGVDIAEVAALMGDVARANMLAALMDGRALTAFELAQSAHVTPQTASSHLAKLTQAHLLEMEKQGRHRYFRLASPRVAETLELVLNLVADGPPRHRPVSRIDTTMRTARSCYDHIAGRLGVGLADCLVARGFVVIDTDAGEVTPAGLRFLQELGADLAPRSKSRRVFCRPCLDWTERRHHLAGHVGAALAQHCIRGRLGAPQTRQPRADDHAARRGKICANFWRGARGDARPRRHTAGRGRSRRACRTARVTPLRFKRAAARRAPLSWRGRVRSRGRSSGPCP
ncbi:MAG: hypothetical protein NVSMB26_26520 [Beijerinckiaceae bacterium]